MDRLLERPVVVAEPRRVLTRVHPGAWSLADCCERSVACLAGIIERGRLRDLAGVREPLEELLLLWLGELGGGVKTLPQQREGLSSLQQPGVDPRAAQNRVNLVGESLALDCSLYVGPPQSPSAGGGPGRMQLLAAVVDDRLVGHDDPPPRRHRRLLGTGGRADGLSRCRHEPPASGSELGLAGELIARGSDLGRASVGG